MCLGGCRVVTRRRGNRAERCREATNDAVRPGWLGITNERKNFRRTVPHFKQSFIPDSKNSDNMRTTFRPQMFLNTPLAISQTGGWADKLNRKGRLRGIPVVNVMYWIGNKPTQHTFVTI